ncbi:NADH dehydrogenase [Angomonas deanei]|uniref:Pyridine nucleotide-disulphide oxidoreductase, putative n=1 Tax=Angomonas deanei TaxID=59799 RepID=S9V9W8_9TRYP|nr:NADH dehydrogenase [Angomonas deanei]EPY37804.1 NADH dehydrogenase [Angomonas deanei]EPY42236.1 NADH dehydrogenase [Angomonas deanei]CAD2213134.1 Pyridine nucleotide-disulphide oxidoreductase, putative [Angomonas deanei]|eukprot:EPY37341.1 NADH dehydrogenase [Angomonas deanei]
MFRSLLRLGSKPTLTILGTGWAGCYAAYEVDPSRFNIEVVSTRNHMVFTPLLPQTTTGTLEFRSVCEPITNIQPALSKPPHQFYRSFIYDVDFEQREVSCVGVGVVGATSDVPAKSFKIKYDYLLMAHGARPNTFNIPGVEDQAFFLREVNEARAIRKRIVQNIMAANLPVTSEEEMKTLLHTVVVGGGPTGIEFAAALGEFLRHDIQKIDKRLEKYCKVTILEAGEVFGMFDEALRNYGKARLDALGIEIKKTAVVGVSEREVYTKSGETIGCGLVVWSTGVGPCMLTKGLKCDKSPRGRIAVDDHLRVLRDGKPIPNVFAAGDCAANPEKPLPTLAAVASRQGRYVGKQLNNIVKTGKMTAPFEYKSAGSMVSIGDAGAVIQLPTPKKSKNIDIMGMKALFLWKSAYVTILGSLRSKLYVIVNWCGSKIFGRDITFIGDLSEDALYNSLAMAEVNREKSRQMGYETLKKMEPVLTVETEGDAETKASEAGEKKAQEEPKKEEKKPAETEKKVETDKK